MILIVLRCSNTAVEEAKDSVKRLKEINTEDKSNSKPGQKEMLFTVRSFEQFVFRTSYYSRLYKINVVHIVFYSYPPSQFIPLQDVS